MTCLPYFSGTLQSFLVSQRSNRGSQTRLPKSSRPVCLLGSLLPRHVLLLITVCSILSCSRSDLVCTFYLRGMSHNGSGADVEQTKYHSKHRLEHTITTPKNSTFAIYHSHLGYVTSNAFLLLGVPSRSPGGLPLELFNPSVSPKLAFFLDILLPQKQNARSIYP